MPSKRQWWNFIGMIVLMGSLAFSWTSEAHAAQSPNISMFVDGQPAKLTKKPVTINNVNYILLKDVLGPLGGRVQWMPEINTVIVTKNAHQVEMKIGDTTAVINNYAVKLSSAPKMINGNIMVPLRFVSEAFGADVEWDIKAGTLRITSDKKLLSSISAEPTGSTASNSNNNSFAVQQGDQIFALEDEHYGAVSFNEGGYLFTIRKDGTGKTALLPTRKLKSLNLQGEWLYFIIDNDVYKMKTNGTSLTRLTKNQDIRQIYLMNNWLVFDNHEGIFRMQTDRVGAPAIRILETAYTSLEEFTVSKGWIYFREFDYSTDVYHIVKINVDGTQKSSYGIHDYRELTVQGNYMYFTYDVDDTTNVGRMPISGGSIQKLVNNLRSFNLTDDKLYYTRDMYLYRSELDGSGSQKIIELDEWSAPESFILLGNDMYYESNRTSFNQDNADLSEIYTVDLNTNLTDSLFGQTMHIGYKQAIISDRYNQPYTLENQWQTDAYNAAKSIVEQTIRPSMSDREKTQALHDYVVLNTEYDYDNYLKDTIPAESYSEYGILVLHKGVCQGYAEAMKLLLDMVGVESYVITGTANGGGHAWNIVVLDGFYYHLDATWDDPVPDRKGRTRNTYFLITDEQMAVDHVWNRDEVRKLLTEK